ncbi:hypothetical protein GCM10010168_37200 [Actinoplanes ianthinogenes]|uniref:Uncharacterized protein n=1 Tax=Actinoplanes ianthinogenes TaxID=122358 RepID=A0ABM7M524_9ACTN|nr:hypothetical protein [Actinoplanes ianthinogenes]BCJ46758.1 hypothetical protein Aiant_74150 [Actinoplanes ianthinogenes]GGR15797.1 hypothetical protein GCM10010168_37200 [Actinoplanes ianthinogenes]
MITPSAAVIAAILLLPAPATAALSQGSPAGAEAVGGSSVARGPDGASYFGDRSGRVLRVAPGQPSQVYATGLPGIIGLSWGADQRLYARTTTRKRLHATVLIQVSRTGAHRVVAVETPEARR